MQIPLFLLIASINTVSALTLCGIEYEIERSIGEGANGKVYRAKAPDGTLVAIKMESSKVADAEIAVLNLLDQGPNLLQLICAAKSKRSTFIVTEYCSGGDLASYLRQVGFIDELTARQWLVQLANGLAYMRVKSVLHGDLKAENILLCYPSSRSNPVLKIADFGNSVILRPGAGLRGEILGTPTIVAPEVFRNEAFGRGVDLWAVGIVVFEMLFGRHPFGPFHFPEGSSPDLNDWNTAVSTSIEERFKKHYYVDIPNFPKISAPLARLIQQILSPVEYRIPFPDFHVEVYRLAIS